MILKYVLLIPALVFFIRFLLQYTDCDYFNPISKIINNITKYPLRLIGNKTYQNINVSALIMMLIFAEIFGSIIITIGLNVPLSELFADLNSIVFVFLLNIIFLLDGIFSLFLILLIISAVLSWIPSCMRYAILFNKLVSPIIKPIDKIIPPIGMISISFIIAFLLIQFINNYAIVSLYKLLFNAFAN